MALSARYSKASDTFDSSISASWSNGEGNAFPFTWISGGHVSADFDATYPAMLRRNTGTYGNNQYSKVVGQTIDGSNALALLGAAVRMQSADQSGYLGVLRAPSDLGAKYAIYETNSTFGPTELANGTTGAPATWDAGSYVVLEITGSGSLELYTSENGGAETSRLTVTDSSSPIGSGWPGIVGYRGSSSDTLTVTAWEGGDDVSTTSIEQEGFRFGVDDDTESAHTWAAAQDTNVTRELDTATLLRVLLNATGDPASQAYALRYQKNGSGGYVAVPVGATTSSLATLQYVGGTNGGGTGSSYTVSLNGTLTGGIASSPSEGDLILVACGHGGTASGAPTCSGNTSGAYTGVHTALYSNDTWDTNFRAFRQFAGATPDVTLTIGRTNNTTYGGHTAVHVWRNVDPDTPFDVTTTTNSASNQSASRPNAPSITPTTAGAVIIAAGAGMQTTSGGAFTIPSGMTNGRSGKTDGSTSDCGTFMASYAWTSGAYDPAAVTGGTTSTSGSHASCTMALRPKTIVTNNEIYIATSGNITAGGESTTARLTAPSGKSSGSDFTTGRRWDDENGSDSIDIAADDYTELEWSLKAQSPAANDDYFDFRVYVGSTPLDTYTVTPRWTIGSSGVALGGAGAAAGAATGALSITKEVAGAAAAAAEAAAALSKTATLVGEAVAAGSVQGAIELAVNLAAQAQAAADAAAELSKTAALAAEAAGAGAAVAGLQEFAQLAGDAQAAGLASADLTLEVPLAGAAAAAGEAAEGDLSKTAAMQAGATGAAEAAGDVSKEVPLAGEAVGSAASDAGVEKIVGFDGAAQAAAEAAGELSRVATLQIEALGGAAAAGDLSIVVNLSGNAESGALAAADLWIDNLLSAAVQAAGAAAGDLSVAANLAGEAVGGGEATGQLSAQGEIFLTGAADASGDAGGELSIEVQLQAAAHAAGSAAAELLRVATLQADALAAAGAGAELTVDQPQERELAGDALASGVAAAEIAKPDTLDVPAEYHGSGLEARVRAHWDRIERERAAAIEADDKEAMELATLFLHFRKAA